MFSVGASFNVNSSHRRMSLSSAAWASSSSAIRKIHFTDALLSGKGTIRKNYVFKAKTEYFGVDLKTDISVESDVVRPFSKIKGHLIIDTKFPIEHDGIFIQLEAHCSLNYSTKHNERTTVHKGKGCILQGTKVNPFGHLESEFRCDIVPVTPPEFGGHSINSGVWHYPFQLDIPCDPRLPAPFHNSHGNLDYRLVVYMISHSSATYVKLAEQSMRCDGHYNLYDDMEEASKPIVIEQYYRKSYFSNKKLVKATLTVQSSGFLIQEDIPFSVFAKNPKCIPLHMSVSLQQHVKYQADCNHASMVKVVTTIDSQEWDESDEPKSEIQWDARLRIPELQTPTYTCNSMYSVNYILEVKSLEEIIITGQSRILLGTTRDPVKQLESTSDSSINSSGGAGGGDLYRSGSESSLHSQRSIFSLPLAYSVPANLNLSIDEPDDDENIASASDGTTVVHHQDSSPSPVHPPPQVADHSDEGHHQHLPLSSVEMTETESVQEPIPSPSPSYATSDDTSLGRRHSAQTALTLPPSYSQLSSRIPSTETLPPTYADLDFSVDSPSSLIIGDAVDLENRYSINVHSLNLDDKYQVTFYSV